MNNNDFRLNFNLKGVDKDISKTFFKCFTYTDNLVIIKIENLLGKCVIFDLQDRYVLTTVVSAFEHD